MKFSPSTMDDVKALVTSEKILIAMGYLKGRWQDEQEYEDINEYGKYFAKSLSECWLVIKAQKRPFGFQLRHKAEPNRTFTLFVTPRLTLKVIWD